MQNNRRSNLSPKARQGDYAAKIVEPMTPHFALPLNPALRNQQSSVRLIFVGLNGFARRAGTLTLRGGPSALFVATVLNVKHYLVSKVHFFRSWC